MSSMFNAAAARRGPCKRAWSDTTRVLGHARPQMRDYMPHQLGTVFVVVRPWPGRNTWLVSMERRTTSRAGNPQCWQCNDAFGMLDAVAGIAADLAQQCPPPVLRILLADDMDAGLVTRVGLVLLAAVQSPHLALAA